MRCSAVWFVWIPYSSRESAPISDQFASSTVPSPRAYPGDTAGTAEKEAYRKREAAFA
jgi:hypothetical protein